MLNSRSVSVDLDGVDAVLGEAAALQEGTVFTDLHALAREVTGLEQLDAIVLAVLTEGRKTRISLQVREAESPSGEKEQKTLRAQI